MKPRVIIISVVVLAAAVTSYFFLFANKAPVSDQLDMAELQQMPESKQEKILVDVISSGRLPPGKEVEFLEWGLVRSPDETQDLLRSHSGKFPKLPRFLSDAALALIKKQEADAGLSALTLARELYPSDPDVLGVTGVIAFLGGKTLDARQFLDEAESWRQHRPLVDFYLGGILILSDSTADRTRGKNLLMRVVNGVDPEYRELAGLSLLGNRNIPMIKEDIEKVYNRLKEDSVFRTNNDNLSAEVLRILLNRIVPYMPKEALSLADLLIEYPESNDQDRMGVIQLAQTLGNMEKAQEYLSTVNEEDTFAEGSDQALRLERLQAVQLILEQRFEPAISAIRTVVETQPASPELQNLFKTAFAYKLPMEIERELLSMYIKLPVASVRTSLSVIERLMSIDPLGEDQWIDYATNELLHRDPLLIGQWLTSIGASRKIINSIGTKSDKSANEYLLLVNSYLEVGDPEKAQAALDISRDRFDPSIVAYLQARIHEQQGNTSMAFDTWKDAYQGATTGKTFPLLKNLGILAIKLDQNVSALQSLYAAFSAGVPFSSGEAGELLDLTLEYGNLQQSIEVTDYLVELNPDEVGYQNNLAYFKFLAEEEVETFIEKMRAIVDDKAEVPQYRLTLALGLLKSGRINEADRLVQSTNVDWNKMDTRGKMIYAVVLAATDKRVLAEGLIQNMSLDELIPEEKALLEAF